LPPAEGIFDGDDVEGESSSDASLVAASIRDASVKVGKNKGNATPPAPKAAETVKSLFGNLYAADGAGIDAIVSKCADDVDWDDTGVAESVRGPEAVRRLLTARIRAAGSGVSLAIDRVADGEKSTGFTWYYRQEDVEGKGLRGTTFVSFNNEGKIDYVREVAEPLYKPGSAVAGLLRAVAEKGMQGKPIPPKPVYTQRTPVSASETVSYLWNEVQGGDINEALRLFAEDVYYEDFNFPVPFEGKDQVSCVLLFCVNRLNHVQCHCVAV
jgi:ketosteroid isomerase-like protein